MVHIQSGTIKDFIEKSIGKKVICFGAGEHLDYIFEHFLKEELYRYIDAVADNNEDLWGSIKRYREKEYPIISFRALCRYAEQGGLLIIVTSHWRFNEIIEQMDQESALDRIEVFVSDLLVRPVVKYPPFEIQKRIEKKIPQMIHCCWFGMKKIPTEYLMYMESWKKYCPDYEIRLWNEDNYDVTKNQYMKQAYDKGMWAFVSDYARADVVYEQGGIYLDCDVELLKPLDDFLGAEMYCGFEDYRHINLGLGFGAVAGHPYLKALLNYYEQITFMDEQEKMNLVACPFYQTEVIQQYGIVPENKFQQADKITAYPTEVFSPYSYWGIGKVTDKSYSIHHYSASWKKHEDRLKFEQWKQQLKKLYERIWEQENN